jgi:type II secretory pathway pseudopilin PulG
MRRLPREKGFSLLMIVLIFVVVAAAGVGAAFFAAKIKTIAAERQTSKRMLAIQAAAEQYYRGHPDTGLPGPSPGEVPTADLNLPQNHRYDAWGKPFEYYRESGNIVGVKVDTTDNGVDDGNWVAGYILSGGLNQNIESTLNPITHTITKQGDDILVPINVQAEAIEITVAELAVLSQKSCAYLKACQPNLVSYANLLEALIGEYSLNATYKTDPWGHDYILNPATNNNFYSSGPNSTAGYTTDDIYGPPLGSECVCPPPPPISGFSFNPADIITFFGFFVAVSPSAGSANAVGLSFPANGISPQSSGGADGGGYITFDPTFLNTGLRVNEDLRPSTYPKLTVSVWVRPDVAGGNHAVFSTDTNATAQLERLIRQSGGNYSVSGGLSGNYSDGPVTTGAWHHLAAVYDQTVPNVTLYLDGVAVIGPSAANMPNNQVFQFGNFVYFIGVRGPIGMFFGTQWIFNGDIDEFRIYPDALSAAQINVLFHEFD